MSRSLGSVLVSIRFSAALRWGAGLASVLCLASCQGRPHGAEGGPASAPPLPVNIAAVLPTDGCATIGDGRQWCTTDVGAVGNAGSSTDYQTTGSATTFTLSTSGWGAGISQVATDAQDSVRYVYTQPVPADGAPNVEIVARLVSADDNMQAGLMIRESNDPNARMAALWLSPKINDSCYRGGQGVLGSINFSDRAYFNGSSTAAFLTSNHASTRDEAPLWMKIQRKGNDFAAYLSRDGTHWTGAGGGQIATATTELGLYVGGLWNVGNTKKTAVFDNVRVGPIQQTYTTTWIGASAVADSTDFVSVNMQGLYVAPSGNVYKYAADAESGHNLNKINSSGQIVPIWPAWNGFVGVQQGGIAADASHMFLGLRSNTNPESYYVQGRVLSSDPVTEMSIYLASGSDSNGYATFDAAMPLGRIGGMATGNGKLYISDFDNNVIRTLNTTTMVEDTAHRFTFSRPGLLAVDHAGNLWIANQPDYPDGPDLFWSRALDPCQSNCVSSVIECHHPDGTACLNGTTPIKITGINNPTALAIDPNPLVSTSSPDRLLVADNGPDQNIKICTQLGAANPTCSATFGVAGGIYEASGPGLYEVAGSSPRFYAVRGIGTDQAGDLYVASSAPHTEIRKFTKNASGSWNTTSAWATPVDGLGLEPGAFDPLSDGNDYFTLTQHFTFDTSKTVAGTE